MPKKQLARKTPKSPLPERMVGEAPSRHSTLGDVAEFGLVEKALAERELTTKDLLLGVLDLANDVTVEPATRMQAYRLLIDRVSPKMRPVDGATEDPNLTVVIDGHFGSEPAPDIEINEDILS